MQPTAREIERSLRRAERGLRPDHGEATALLSARGEQLETLLAVAGGVRDAGLRDLGRPGTVTYSPKVFIPLTRLCRDHCHYCTFATDPAALRREGQEPFLRLDQVLAIARAGAAAGCAEALFTLGDTPETRWPQARRWLAEAGYPDTVSYLRAAAIAVLEDTGLLPHLNPGVLSWSDLRRLRPVAASMGLMVESTARRLFTDPGEVHHGSPDKDPDLRLRVLTDAGRLSIPFTTGLLLGIGETDAEFVDGVLAIRAQARAFGHVQEVLVQNLRVKPGTAAARTHADADADRYLAALATARLLLGPGLRLQAPPNLSDPATVPRLVAAGVDDLGGISPVTPDHVNPERPWPQLAALAADLAGAGWRLVPRLAVHPPYVTGGQWLDPRIAGHVAALAGPDGLAAAPIRPAGRPWQEPDPGYEQFAATAATAPPAAPRPAAPRPAAPPVPAAAPRTRIDAELARALDLAARDPAALAGERHHGLALALMSCDGAALDTLAAIADDVRRDTVGDDVTYVINRNLNFTNVCYTGCRFCAFAQRESDPDAVTLSLAEIGAKVDEAAAAGATEICMQGGIHPKLPGTAYFDLAAAVKRHQPGLHLHAFSPMEIVNGAGRSGMPIAEWLTAAQAAGVDSIPGTAAEILDDDVRWILTKGKLPTAAWVEVIRTAHRVGLPSTATMMYGHVDQPRHWVAHLRLIRSIALDTGGFTEFVPLPFIHQQTPLYLAGTARPGPTVRDNRAVHAMARLLLHGAIDNIQCSWVKLGAPGCQVMLRGGANDLGGTLMEESISAAAGSGHGTSMSVAGLRAVAAGIGRPARQRTSRYGVPGQPAPGTTSGNRRPDRAAHLAARLDGY